MAVTPIGEEIAASLREWLADEITEASTRIFELAKFLFGVSSGSVGVLVTISNLSGNSWTLYEWGALAAFVISAVFALWLAFPRVHKLHAEFDLGNAHSRIVKETKWVTAAWAVSWFAALIFAGLGFAEAAPAEVNCISGI